MRGFVCVDLSLIQYGFNLVLSGGLQHSFIHELLLMFPFDHTAFPAPRFVLKFLSCWLSLWHTLNKDTSSYYWELSFLKCREFDVANSLSLAPCSSSCLGNGAHELHDASVVGFPFFSLYRSVYGPDKFPEPIWSTKKQQNIYLFSIFVKFLVELRLAVMKL